MSIQIIIIIFLVKQQNSSKIVQYNGKQTNSKNLKIRL